MYARELFSPRSQYCATPSLGVVETFSAHLRLIREIKRKDSSVIVFSSKSHLTVWAVLPCPRKREEPHWPMGLAITTKDKVYVIYSEQNKETKTYMCI